MDRRIAEQLSREVMPIEPLAACDRILHEVGALIQSLVPPADQKGLFDSDRIDTVAGLLLAVAKSAQAAILFLSEDPRNANSLHGSRLADAVEESLGGPIGYAPDGEGPWASERVLHPVDVSTICRLVGGVAGSMGEDSTNIEGTQVALVDIIGCCAATLARGAGEGSSGSFAV